MDISSRTYQGHAIKSQAASRCRCLTVARGTGAPQLCPALATALKQLGK